MARNVIRIAAPPEQVFDLLADPRTYARWVTGTHRICAADPSWPEPGSMFDHQTGSPPLIVTDTTTVIDAAPPEQLVLRVGAGPLPDALVSLRLQADGEGTRVTMVEDPAHPLLRLLSGPLGHGLMRVRNRESLRRLKQLAEGGMPRPRSEVPNR